jgi:3-hydroxyisobutyrate dehydrogenase-like beta-hydroxyacid dehydrogenase
MGEANMGPTIVVIAVGEMGAGVAQRLRLRGATVRTSLRGRSDASRKRAEAAGLTIIDDDDKLVADADFVLSIVPPGEVKKLAERLALALMRATKKPVFADCNAVAPTTVCEVAAIIAPTGCAFADMGILGGPPSKDGTDSPRIYASGDGAARTGTLKEYGLDMYVIDGKIGDASAVKMGYACLTKGTQAIAASMMLGSMRNEVAPHVKDALADSLPELFGYAERMMPRMYPKAYRWVAEMDEISKFLAADPGASQMLAGAARLYEQIARDVEERNQHGPVGIIDGFLKG